MNLIKEGGDERGKILFITHDNAKINLFEIKKGSVRGGHYHDYPITHVLLLGKVEYRQEDIMTKNEKISTLSAPALIQVPPKMANLIIALEDSIFTEVFHTDYSSSVYEKYRSVVSGNLNKKR